MSARRRTEPDWERIEADYRAGVLSLREIASKDGKVSEGAIRKRAKKFGWSRDLSALIRSKADELVRSDAARDESTHLRTASESSKALISEVDEATRIEAVRAHGTQGTQRNSTSTYTDQAIVDANAQAIAAIRLAHRTDIARARRLCLALTDELELLTGAREQLREFIDAIDGQADDTKAIEKLRAVLEKALGLPVRAGTLKALADSLRTLVTLEREAWQIDEGGTPSQTYDDFLAEFYGERSDGGR